MLQTLSTTNNNIAVISAELKATAIRINQSAVWDVLNDKGIGNGLRASLKNIANATANANKVTLTINSMLTQARYGKSVVGTLLADTLAGNNLREAISKIKTAGNNADQMTANLNALVLKIDRELINGKGSLNTLLRDSVMAQDLKKSMDNIQKGTDAFNQDMEALKHNFLFSGYFKKLEKEKAKQANRKN